MRVFILFCVLLALTVLVGGEGEGEAVGAAAESQRYLK